MTSLLPGYKTSPLGPIPQDWDVLKLGKVVDILDNKRKPFNSDERKYMIGDVPYYGANGLVDYVNDYIFDEDLILIAEDGGYFDQYKTRPIAYKISGKSWVNNHAHVLKSKKNYDQNYVFYSLEHKNILLWLNGGTRAKLNKSELEKLTVSMPERKEEQQAIGSILTTCDKSISTTQTLIDRLQRRHKALCQQLLSGKKRLQRFREKREMIPIKDIAKEVSRKNKNDDEMIVLSCTKYKGLIPSLEYFGKKIYSNDLTTYKIVPRNTFAYATNHIEEGSIGYQDKYNQALISPMYTIFQTDDTVNDAFLFKVLKSYHYIHEYQKRMEGSIDRRGGLRRDEFAKIKIPHPNIQEQSAIASILNASQMQIDLAQAKLTKLKQHKQGLMQQLLTGKTRVPSDYL